jgi:polysaccharide biosynthesis transport protein
MPDVEDRTSQPSLTPARLVIIARRRWWIVFVCLLLAAGGSVAYVKERPAPWAATAVVNVQPLPTVAGSSALPSLPGPDPTVEVQTPAVLRAAASAAGLAEGKVHLVATTATTVTTIDVTATAPTASQASKAARAAAVTLAANRLIAVAALGTGLDTQISALGVQINQLAAQAKTNSADAAKLAVVQAELQDFYTQQQNYQVAAQAVTVATNAAPIAHRTGTSRARVIELSLLGGLLVGCAIALISDRLDDRLRSASELAEYGDVALLAELPTRALAGRTSFIDANPHDELSEAVRQLRTALRFLSVDKPLRTLLVTSAAAGEGKSFVAASLGVALAVSGTRTILVSSDLRRPGLEGLLGLPPSSKGLSEAIADAALTAYSTAAATRTNGATEAAGARAGTTSLDLTDLLVETGVPNLQLVPAGASPPNPAELLGSTHMAELIDALEARADIVILDSPPLLAVTDALVLTTHADGVLMVMAKGRTSRANARRALRLLDSGLAPVLGVAFNRSDRSGGIPYPYSDAAGPRSTRSWRRSQEPSARAPGDRKEIGAHQRVPSP